MHYSGSYALKDLGTTGIERQKTPGAGTAGGLRSTMIVQRRAENDETSTDREVPI